MNQERLFKSIAIELEAKKDQYKNSGGKHSLTEGEWKESTLKTLIQRHLPANIGIGSGFVVNEKESSTQIDILLYDLNKPILFKNEDKGVISITPDTVKGIIEVKTAIPYISDFEKVSKKLFDNLNFVRKNGNLEYIYAGIFSYETNMRPNKNDVKTILKNLYKCSTAHGYISNINHVSLGKNLFIKYWDEDPQSGTKVYNTWHGYKLKDMAQAYFIMNAVIEVSDNSHEINSRFWFPPQGKEEKVIVKLKLT